MKSKLLNVLLFASFIVTIMVPFTGIIVHKMASLLFLILCVIHTIVERKRLNGKRYALLAVIVIAFVSGILGMIFDDIPFIMAFHKMISIASVFFLAIHIFIYQKKLRISFSNS